MRSPLSLCIYFYTLIHLRDSCRYNISALLTSLNSIMSLNISSFRSTNIILCEKLTRRCDVRKKMHCSVSSLLFFKKKGKTMMNIYTKNQIKKHAIKVGDSQVFPRISAPLPQCCTTWLLSELLYFCTSIY